MLNELEKDKLQLLLGDAILMAIIEKFLKDAVERAKPRVQAGDSDLIIGQKYRAYEDARQILEIALMDLKSYEREKAISKSINRAR